MLGVAVTFLLVCLLNNGTISSIKFKFSLQNCKIFAIYLKNDRAGQMARLFNGSHLYKNVPSTVVRELMQKYLETKTMEKKIIQSCHSNEGMQIAILGHITKDNTFSTRHLSKVSGISRT